LVRHCQLHCCCLAEHQLAAAAAAGYVLFVLHAQLQAVQQLKVAGQPHCRCHRCCFRPHCCRCPVCCT
jgi:hypothetical protein